MILRLETVLLRPPQVHAQQHLGPVLGLEPARAGVDLQECALVVVVPGKHVGPFYGLDMLLELCDGVFDIRSDRLLVLFCKVDQYLEVLPEREIPSPRLPGSG